jgi:hypothetical protein
MLKIQRCGLRLKLNICWNKLCLLWRSIHRTSTNRLCQFLVWIGIQADADGVVFGGMRLIFDDYYPFRTAFESAGVFVE